MNEKNFFHIQKNVYVYRRSKGILFVNWVLRFIFLFVIAKIVMNIVCIKLYGMSFLFSFTKKGENNLEIIINPFN